LIRKHEDVLTEKVTVQQDRRPIVGEVLFDPVPSGARIGSFEVVEDAHQLLGMRAARGGTGRATSPFRHVDGADVSPDTLRTTVETLTTNVRLPHRPALS